MKCKSVLVFSCLVVSAAAQPLLDIDLTRDSDVSVWAPDRTAATQVFTVAANSLVGLKTSSESGWRILDDDVPFAAFTIKDGAQLTWAFLVYTGGKPRDIRVDRFFPGKALPDRYILRVGNGPVPPEPVPIPVTGFAKEVFDSAQAVDIPVRTTEAGKILTAFGNVKTAIAAGGVKDVVGAYSMLQQEVKRFTISHKWQPTLNLIANQCNKAKTLDDLKVTFSEVVKGLEALK